MPNTPALVQSGATALFANPVVSEEQRNLAEIVSFAVADNVRSTAVMKRIGMRPDPARDFDHPGVPDSHPQLRRHVLYAITADEWRRRHDRPG